MSIDDENTTVMNEQAAPDDPPATPEVVTVESPVENNLPNIEYKPLFNNNTKKERENLKFDFWGKFQAQTDKSVKGGLGVTVHNNSKNSFSMALYETNNGGQFETCYNQNLLNKNNFSMDAGVRNQLNINNNNEVKNQTRLSLELTEKISTKKGTVSFYGNGNVKGNCSKNGFNSSFGTLWGGNFKKDNWTLGAEWQGDWTFAQTQGWQEPIKLVKPTTSSSVNIYFKYNIGSYTTQRNKPVNLGI